jgi:hypothetical protein
MALKMSKHDLEHFYKPLVMFKKPTVTPLMSFMQSLLCCIVMLHIVYLGLIPMEAMLNQHNENGHYDHEGCGFMNAPRFAC